MTIFAIYIKFERFNLIIVTAPYKRPYSDLYSFNKSDVYAVVAVVVAKSSLNNRL